MSLPPGLAFPLKSKYKCVCGVGRISGQLPPPPLDLPLGCATIVLLVLFLIVFPILSTLG